MPGYGVSAGAASLRSWSWAEEILRAGHNYWLSTTRPDGRARHAVIVEGVASPLPVSEAPPEIARLYAAKYGEGYPPDSPLYRVTPRVAFGFSEAQGEFAETAMRWSFERE